MAPAAMTSHMNLLAESCVGVASSTWCVASRLPAAGSVPCVEVDGVVVTAQLVAGAAVEGDRLPRLLVDEQRDRPRPGKQLAAELREAPQAVTAPALLGGDPDPLDVLDRRGLRDDVGLEDQAAFLDPDPDPPLLDAAQAAPAE